MRISSWRENTYSLWILVEGQERRLIAMQERSVQKAALHDQYSRRAVEMGSGNSLIITSPKFLAITSLVALCLLASQVSTDSQ